MRRSVWWFHLVGKPRWGIQIRLKVRLGQTVGGLLVKVKNLDLFFLQLVISHQGVLGCVMESNTINYVGTHPKIGEVLLGEGSGEKEKLQRSHYPCSTGVRRDVREVCKAETKLLGLEGLKGVAEVKK